MTFEQFQATRRYRADLTKAIEDARWMLEPPPNGFTYLGDQLYIEFCQEHWPEAARKKGLFYLLLGWDEWISNDLTALERRLYDWAITEGYGEEGDAP